MSEAAARVDEARLWQRHMDMAQHGARPDGGVDRQALSPEDAAAQRTLVEWGQAIGLAASADAAGNLFLRYEGTEPALPPVLTGSHLDSQPTGGRFDGVYGVLAGLEAVQAIAEAGIRPHRPIEVVAWMNEEGSRFAPGMMGSEAFVGWRTVDEIRAVRDAAGVAAGDALDACRRAGPEVPMRPLGGPVAAYVEAHIEQGPLLEAAAKTIGVVTGIQGKLTFRVTVSGAEAHAGTAPRRDRRDALLAAARMAGALEAATADPADVVRFTIGAFTVKPNAPSVVPSEVRFSIDLRHPDPDTLTRLGAAIAPVCAAEAGPCTVTVEPLVTAMSLSFPEAMQARIAGAAGRLGLPAMHLFSAAGHDARQLHAVCPSGMIFVPCRQGISHHVAEWAESGHLAAGARVLAETLLDLAR